MVLSKRERYIATGTVTVVAILAVYYILFSPLLERMKKLDADISARKLEQERAQRLIDDSRRLGPVLNKRIAGPLKKSASEAESQMLKSIADWARDARMSPPSIDKPDRIDKEKEFSKMTFRATAGGTMAQIGSFLWHLHTSDIPVRITDMTIATHKEGYDDLTVQLGISTIFLASDDKVNRPTAAAPTAAAAPAVPSKEGKQ